MRGRYLAEQVESPRLICSASFVSVQILVMVIQFVTGDSLGPVRAGRSNTHAL